MGTLRVFPDSVPKVPWCWCGPEGHVFFLILIIFFILNLLKPDTEVSQAERRKLTQFPEINVKSILDGTFAQKFEKYTTDQIISRDEFRKLKSKLEFSIFRKKDNNGIYMYQNSIIKTEYPLNENSILKATEKINSIKNQYLNGLKCYYSIVPDKNYFTNKNEYVSMDYDRLQNIMIDNIKDMKYINIFDCLELQDYYVTDIHWKQENLQKVVKKINSEMDIKDKESIQYTRQEITEFDGVYAGELPAKTKKDKICILTNEIIENAKVYNYENRKETKVYDKEKLSSKDKYDIYLSGSTPIITIENSQAKTNKELIIFRDSFASSLAPLFIKNYKKITLVDIRYMRSKDLEKYINFNNQEVLFLYSTIVLNNSNILK